MKRTLTISSILFVAAIALPFGANAAEGDKGMDAKAPAMEMQTAKPSDSKAKRHSHMEEKTGIPASQTTPAPQSDMKNPAKDTSKHIHSRDGK
jgi:hypothetical protein